MGLRVNIKKRVNGFTLDTSWEIGNELAVLFGQSGAGKSLTLQLIAGLMKPDSGFIKSGGNDYFDSALGINIPPCKRSFGYVFQDLALFPHMSVRENILYGSKGVPKDERVERLEELTAKFRIRGIEDKMPSEISGGQKQRVAFARALIRRPEVLLLDEPFSALDSSLRIEMRAFLAQVREEFNLPVVLVTHDVYEAFTMPDRLIVYSNGRVVQTGAPSEIFGRPASKEVEVLVAAKDIYAEMPGKTKCVCFDMSGH
jgi:molybdate transport system ATP-binding protein